MTEKVRVSSDAATTVKISPGDTRVVRVFAGSVVVKTSESGTRIVKVPSTESTIVKVAQGPRGLPGEIPDGEQHGDILAWNGETQAWEPEPEPGWLTKVDEATDTLFYVGQAQPGSLDEEEVWRLKRVDISSGVVIEWADGDTNFDNQWDERTFKSYS